MLASTDIKIGLAQPPGEVRDVQTDGGPEANIGCDSGPEYFPKLPLLCHTGSELRRLPQHWPETTRCANCPPQECGTESNEQRGCRLLHVTNRLDATHDDGYLITSVPA